MTHRIAKVILGQQHLGDAAAQTIECIVIQRHQPRLTHCSARLDLFYGRWTGGHSQAFSAEADGSGGDNQNFNALLTKGGNLLH